MFNRFYIIFCFLFCAQTALGIGFYEDKERGWFWYEEFKKPQKKKKQKARTPSTSTIIKEHKAFQKELEESRITAVMYPSLENVKKYRQLQEAVIIKSNEFAKNFQLAALLNPLESISQANGGNNLALQILKEEESKKQDAKIRKIASNSGLVVFVDPKCKFSIAYTKTLKTIKEKFGFPIVLVGEKQGYLDGFEIKTNQRLMKHLDVKLTPSTYLYSSANNSILPLAYGLTSLSDFSQNIMLIEDYIKAGQKNEHN